MALLRELATRKHLIVRNKTDLPCRLSLPPEVSARAINVSCVTGGGIEALKDAIKQLVWSGDLGADMIEVMINSRHEGALRRAREAVQKTLTALEAGEGLEVAALELRIAISAVGEIVGKTTTEDLLDSIFSQFCIGK